MDVNGGVVAAESPLLGTNVAVERWWKWNKLLDVEEAKDQISLSLPLILANASYYFITLVSVMFAGHLGELELAAANLANSWATATGFAFMVGLSGALETLCGQGYGAKLYEMLGIYLQTSCMLSSFFAFLVSILWWYSEFIFTLLHQDPQISKAASLYLKYLIPGLFAYGFLQNILRFLQMQSVVSPLVVCSLFVLIIHVGITYALFHWTSFGIKGAALSASISLWILVLILGLYVLRAKNCAHTWNGLTLESFRFIFSNLKLALPSAAMMCLEEWAFELLVLLAGMMPNSKTNTSLIAMCANTESICYMLACGLGATASTRVSNELGAGNSDRARRAMTNALKLAILIALAVIFALTFGHNLWASCFSYSPEILQAFSSMTPLLLVSISCDFFQAILSGVTRGCGWQHLGVCISLATFYLIGMPIAVLLGFKMKLYAQGLWIGLICGLSLQTLGLLWLTKISKWTRIELTQNCSNKILEENA
ncbi:MATE efflux family protein ALF5 [Forsythia ovata]|uniref:Protein DETOXIFICATION n=1 Tax=Forsythia ovata TaxID=205694 RepID=A0ABD1R586_9LAMI